MERLAERRKEVRYRIAVPVEYVCPERMLPGFGGLRNISVGGMYVEDIHHDLDVGDAIRAPLWLPSVSSAIFLEGHVVRSDPAGFAVKFEPLLPATEALLREALPVAEQQMKAQRRV